MCVFMCCYIFVYFVSMLNAIESPFESNVLSMYVTSYRSPDAVLFWSIVLQPFLMSRRLNFGVMTFESMKTLFYPFSLPPPLPPKVVTIKIISVRVCVCLITRGGG